MRSTCVPFKLLVLTAQNRSMGQHTCRNLDLGYGGTCGPEPTKTGVATKPLEGGHGLRLIYGPYGPVRIRLQRTAASPQNLGLSRFEMWEGSIKKGYNCSGPIQPNPTQRGKIARQPGQSTLCALQENPTEGRLWLRHAAAKHGTDLA